MSTLNGTGVKYFGWQHLPDGTAQATQWFTVLYMPVIPLRREHLRVLTEPGKQPFFSFKYALSVVTFYEHIGPAPMDWPGVLRTYFNAYILFPLILAAPIAALFLISWLFIPKPAHPGGLAGPTEGIIAAIVFGSFLFYWGYVIHQALSRSRGFTSKAQMQELEAERLFRK